MKDRPARDVLKRASSLTGFTAAAGGAGTHSEDAHDNKRRRSMDWSTRFKDMDHTSTAASAASATGGVVPTSGE